MPVDGKVRLRVGSAFDIRAKRKQTAFERIGPSGFEYSRDYDMVKSSQVALCGDPPNDAI